MESRIGVLQIWSYYYLSVCRIWCCLSRLLQRCNGTTRERRHQTLRRADSLPTATWALFERSQHSGTSPCCRRCSNR